MSCFELNSYCFTKKKKKKKVMHKFLDVWMCKYGITTESNSAKNTSRNYLSEFRNKVSVSLR